MEELTYILGAGASFQSIPLVNTFPKRFSYFIQFMGGLSGDGKYTFTNREKLRLLSHFGSQLEIEFHTHQSFDTYFKKLFHTNNFGKIKLFKKILNLYFIWEHIQDGQGVSDEGSHNKFLKQSSVDKRYDALIAGLLQPLKDEKKLFCKTNFITWNYDLNLICSIKNYFSPETTFKEFLSTISRDKFIWNIGPDISILNMNGYFYSGLFDEKKQIQKEPIVNFICEKIVADYFEDNYNDNDSELIRFAWESSHEDSVLLQTTANNFIKMTKNVVVIGYTFPLYNRLMDLKYLNPSLLHNKIVTIQDPNAEDLLNDFESNFLPQNYNTKLVRKFQCDSFFLPSNIFIK